VTAKRGRPRSESARRAILAAAVARIEAEGYGALTMEEIARHAGVSKQTVYRWWPSKAAILLEALTEGAAAAAPQPDTGALGTDLQQFLRSTVRGARRNQRILAALMSEAQLDEALGQAFRDQFLATRRGVLSGIVRRAADRGEVGGAVDPDDVAELAFAALWYRILGGRGRLDRRFADGLADTLIKLTGASGAPRP